MLELPGLNDIEPSRENVSILVGPNGSGKSNFLKELIEKYKGSRNLVVMSNTAHDRFTGMKGIKRIGPGNLPAEIIKRSFIETGDRSDSRLYSITSILEYCGYQPRLGFRIDISKHQPVENQGWSYIYDLNPELQEEIISVYNSLKGPDLSEIICLHSNNFFSATANIVRALFKHENILRREGVIEKIHVYIEKQGGQDIELLRASSGELSLILSLVFLITNAQTSPVIIIDEPENSLHPSWQREYVEKILTAVTYRNATIIIATHAPLIVTGALTSVPDLDLAPNVGPA